MWTYKHYDEVSIFYYIGLVKITNKNLCLFFKNIYLYIQPCWWLHDQIRPSKSIHYSALVKTEFWARPFGNKSQLGQFLVGGNIQVT